MTLALFADRGSPINQQRFTWREVAGKPISKLDDNAFTRVRVISMNGSETEALRFSHAAARFNRDLRRPLAEIRRVEQHQATMMNWLLGADHSPPVTTGGLAPSLRGAARTSERYSPCKSPSTDPPGSQSHRHADASEAG